MADFIADENIDRAIVDSLRRRYSVLYIAEEKPGLSDDEILLLCEREKALLMTADKDFGDLVVRQGRRHHGVMLLRLTGVAPHRKAQIAHSAVDAYLGEMRGNFTVLTKDSVRIRRMHRPV